MLDMAIIGCGPAGLSAAITAAQRNKKIMVIGKGIHTSPLYKAENIDNYLGMPDCSGKELLTAFYQHAVKKGVLFMEGRVLQIFPMDDTFTLNVENEMLEARTVIIATGLIKNKTLSGEDVFLGRGVSYCATCDGMLYKNKSVVLVGETIESESDVDFLSEICAKTYFLPLYPTHYTNPKVIRLTGKPQKVVGNSFVQGLETDQGFIESQGVFFIKESTPVTNLIDGLELENGAIKVNRMMETSIPGLFACGDCTGKPFQVSKAVGEGLTAALQAVSVMARKTKGE